MQVMVHGKQLRHFRPMQVMAHGKRRCHFRPMQVTAALAIPASLQPPANEKLSAFLRLTFPSAPDRFSRQVAGSGDDEGFEEIDR